MGGDGGRAGLEHRPGAKPRGGQNGDPRASIASRRPKKIDARQVVVATAAGALLACAPAEAADYSPDDLCRAIGQTPNIAVTPRDRLFLEKSCAGFSYGLGCAAKGSKTAKGLARREAEERARREREDAEYRAQQERKAAELRSLCDALIAAADARLACERELELAGQPIGPCVERFNGQINDALIALDQTTDHVMNYYERLRKCKDPDLGPLGIEPTRPKNR